MRKMQYMRKWLKSAALGSRNTFAPPTENGRLSIYFPLNPTEGDSLAGSPSLVSRVVPAAALPLRN